MSIYNYIHTEIYSLKSYDVNFLITRIFEPQALSSTNYFSMSILRGSVTSLAWKQAPPWGEEEKKFGQSRGSLRREKGGAALFPSPGHPSARFFRRYFSFLTPFFAFFSHCGAWSQVNDSYTMKHEKLPLNDKITASCLQHIIVNYKQQKGTLKNCQVNKFSKATIEIRFNLLQVCSSLVSFVIVAHLYLLLTVFERLF